MQTGYDDMKSATDILSDKPHITKDGIKYYSENVVLHSIIEYRDQFVPIPKIEPMQKTKVKSIMIRKIAVDVVSFITKFREDEIISDSRKRVATNARRMVVALMYREVRNMREIGRQLYPNRILDHTTIANMLQTHDIYMDSVTGEESYQEDYRYALQLFKERVAEID